MQVNDRVRIGFNGYDNECLPGNEVMFEGVLGTVRDIKGPSPETAYYIEFDSKYFNQTILDGQLDALWPFYEEELEVVDA